MTIPKILKFEGAGWEKADSNGVGNCRIRSTFLNDAGMTIYIEFGCCKTHANSALSMKRFVFPWHISHLHKVNTATGRRDESKNAPNFNGTWDIIKEYTKENILKLVNDRLDCSFNNIEVINDGSWNGFAVDGINEVQS